MLHIDGDQALHIFRIPLIRMVKAFRSLKILTLAPSAMTWPMIIGIASMQRLDAVHIAECGRSVPGRICSDPSPAVDTPLTFSVKNAFQNLSRFAFTASSTTSVTSLLQHDNFPSQSLVDIWIRFPKTISAQPLAIQRLLISMSSHCPSLERLTLRFSPLSTDGLTGDRLLRHITYPDLEPIFLFPNLVEFAIDHALPFLFTHAENVQFARRATRFTKLWLNPYPASTASPSLTLESLVPFAQYCPKLQYLGMYINASNPVCIGGPIPRFKVLKELFVGWSKVPRLMKDPDYISKWALISIFFYRIFPTWTSLHSIADYLKHDPLAFISSDMRLCCTMSDPDRFHAWECSDAWNAIIGLSKLLHNRKKRAVPFQCLCSQCVDDSMYD